MNIFKTILQAVSQREGVPVWEGEPPSPREGCTVLEKLTLITQSRCVSRTGKNLSTDATEAHDKIVLENRIDPKRALSFSSDFYLVL